MSVWFRFPVSQGFAGYVVRTGETILCNDVANDDRFSSQVDQKTGYVTKTILGAPLKMKESYVWAHYIYM